MKLQKSFLRLSILCSASLASATELPSIEGLPDGADVEYTHSKVLRVSAPLWYCAQYAEVDANDYSSCDEVRVEITDLTTNIQALAKGFVLEGATSVFAPTFAGFQNLKDRALEMPATLSFVQGSGEDYQEFDTQQLENWDSIGLAYKHGAWISYENSGAHAVISIAEDGQCEPLSMTYEPMDKAYTFKLKALDPDCE